FLPLPGGQNLKSKRRRWFQLAAILAIILIAAWLRLWRLPDVPPGLDYDEAFEGLDALWMLKTGTPYLFMASNHGREALFLYPVALLMSLLGASPFTLRLTSALAGILTIPLLYRLTKTMFRDDPQRDWLALIAAAGLAVSLWHIGMSRVPLRAILVPLFFTLTAYLFWRGWQAQAIVRTPVFSTNWVSFSYFALAGVALGLSQYTYLSARLFPLVFLLTVLGAWLAQKSKQESGKSPPRLLASSPLPHLWLGLFVMGAVSALVFAPLALLFLQNPAAFSGRAGEVNFQVQWSAEGLAALVQHLAQALSLFLGGSDPRLRHHLVSRPVFDGLTLLAFWSGVVVAVRQWRRPEFFFLLLSVLLLWLPAPLSVDPIHSLRAAGLLPAFFILVALGLLHLVAWIMWTVSKVIQIPTISHTFQALRQPSAAVIGLVSLGLVLLITGGLNTYDYFVRWANHPLVYRPEYKGPEIDLARYAINLTETSDVILPYKFYAYAPIRYLLQQRFREELGLPFPPLERLAEGQPLVYVTWPDEPASSLFVWLSRDEMKQGVAYLTRFQREPDLAFKQPILGSRGDSIGGSQRIDETMLASMYLENPVVVSPFNWGDHIHLGGYNLAAPFLTAGEPGMLTFYWQGLREADLDYKIFIQILDDLGEPISQLEEAIIKEDIQYYENRLGFVAQSHLFWTGPETPAGLYLLRVGLFQPRTG
ncbi:MAG TPA: hypothetical protein VEC96_04395, partial [Anaerolineae bacterium]|nr:hypothetical protein [Anaerolineae bacterium]